MKADARPSLMTMAEASSPPVIEAARRTGSERNQSKVPAGRSLSRVTPL